MPQENVGADSETQYWKWQSTKEPFMYSVSYEIWIHLLLPNPPNSAGYVLVCMLAALGING